MGNHQNYISRTHPGYSRLLPWIIWFLGAFFYFYENLIQVSPGVMVHDLMRDLGIDAAELGVLGGVYFYTYAGVQIPAGVLADNFNIRTLLGTAIIFCILGCFLFGASTGLLPATSGRLLIGLGSGFAAICCMKLATYWFPAKKFPFLVGLMVMLGMTGSMVGEGPLASLIDLVGWRYSMYLLGFLGVILALLVFTIMQKNDENKSESIQHETPKTLLHGLKMVLSCKESWVMAGYGGLMFGPTSIFGGLWGVPYIMAAYGFDKPVAASIVSLLFLGWIIGGPFIGFVAQYIHNKKTIMLSGSFGALLMMSTIVYVQALPIGLLMLAMFLLGVFSSCFLPAFSLIKEIHPTQYSGAALGFMNTANMTGGAVGLPLVGLFLNKLWDGTIVNGIKFYTVTNYSVALSLLPAMFLLALFLGLFIQVRPQIVYSEV